MGEKVAVLGLGASGLAALKNLREAGFDVVGFERNDYIGGLWQYTTNENVTSVIKSTRTNISRLRFTFSDFEYPPELTANYPLAEDIAKYIQGYAAHYDLLRHCRLGVTVEKLERSKDGQAWDITLRDSSAGNSVSTEQYSRVFVCTGPQNRPLLPTHEGIHLFKGRVLHSRAFKDPAAFANQRVVVMGISNTAGDVAVDLANAGLCKEIYVSHRSGARIGTRGPEDKSPLDQKVTRRIGSIILAISPYFPRLMGRIGELLLELGMKSKFKGKLKDEWRLLPAPPIPNVAPVMNDHIIDMFHTGQIKSVHGIKRYLDDGTSIELEGGTPNSGGDGIDDGKILRNIDAVIYCTGYDYDFSYLGPEADPTAYSTPEWDKLEHTKLTRYPRLYWGILSPKYPESLAFIGAYRGQSFSAFSNSDLATAAVAQIWRGSYPVPTKEEMNKWCDAHYRNALEHTARWRTQQLACESGKLQKWLNDASGNGVNEILGAGCGAWGWKAWKFWWNERKLYYLLMDGVDTAYVQRLFEGRGEKGRRRWEGARAAVLRANGEQK
ncbi:hypothetical protein ABW20_dc0101101 [Dactylellina cionopaga]|nr:hypothetical protein ABW20_dc0101101 [Dactylellina cionopaga]